MRDRRRDAAVRAAAAVIGTLLGSPVLAQKISWDVVNEYPQTSLAGEADAFFAEAVSRKAEGRVVVRPIPAAGSGLRSREQLRAVTEGRFAMANSFGGALGDEDPVFLLASLPFVAPSTDEARALYDVARPLYERVFAARRQKLLYVSPWPPSGIWSASPVATLDALRSLRIRTYDRTGTELFASITVTAREISFADLDAKLAAGEINAVLSSGDGGAARELWKHLRHFSDIVYAVPLSFASVSLDAWTSLDERTRAAIEAAGRETAERQWAAMTGRITRNFDRMRASGVVIDERPPADVMAALRAAAARSLADWRTRAEADAIDVLDRSRARTSP